MRRNGSEQSQSGSSGWLSGVLSLAGGIGLGAGLLYLLDPDKGEKRRRNIMKGATGLASSAREYAGDAYDNASGAVGGLLSNIGSYASDKFSSARDYAGDKVGMLGDYAHGATRGVQKYARDRADDAHAYAEKKVFGETHAEHTLHMSICALSSMALGAALMYAFDPQSGRRRRQYAAEQATNFASNAGTYARQAGESMKSGYNTVVEKAADMASTAGDSIKSGYNQVAEKVGSVASSVTGGGDAGGGSNSGGSTAASGGAKGQGGKQAGGSSTRSGQSAGTASAPESGTR